jgi:hypothetical protein
MKTYEYFIKNIQDTVDKYISFLKKYDISYFHINYSENNISIETILNINKKITIEYRHNNNYNVIDLDYNMDLNILKLLMKIQDNILTIEYLFKINIHAYVLISMIKHNTKDLERLIKNYKYFENYYSDDDVEIFNSFEFQDLLFNKSEKISLLFLDYINNKHDNFYTIKIDNKIINKYSKIINKYKKQTKTKKFNL